MTVLNYLLDPDAVRRDRGRQHPLLFWWEESYRTAAFFALCMLITDALGYSMFEGQVSRRLLFVFVVGTVMGGTRTLGLLRSRRPAN